VDGLALEINIGDLQGRSVRATCQNESQTSRCAGYNYLTYFYSVREGQPNAPSCG
jgi:hypothetical protein